MHDESLIFHFLGRGAARRFIEAHCLASVRGARAPV